MVLLIAGALLVAMGLFAGSVLVVAPLGLAPWSADLALWVLFPLFSVVGYALFVVGAKARHVRELSFALSCLLLLLAVSSAAGLVLAAASVVHPIGDTLSLWYVLAIAGVLGTVGVAAHGNTASAA
jgi:hypothetical protein